MKTKLAFATLLTLGSTLSEIRAAVLIDATTLNGGFESASASPWGGLTTTIDASFARTGSNFATISGTRGDAFQFLIIQPNAGQDLVLSFWGRVPASGGFESLSVSLSESGFSRSAAVSPVNTPTLESTNWQLFSYELSIPADWDSTGNSKLSIAFPNGSQSRSAFLDDVTLTQVPEPSTWFIALTSTALLLRRQRPNNQHSIKKEGEQVGAGDAEEAV